MRNLGTAKFSAGEMHRGEPQRKNILLAVYICLSERKKTLDGALNGAHKGTWRYGNMRKRAKRQHPRENEDTAYTHKQSNPPFLFCLCSILSSFFLTPRILTCPPAVFVSRYLIKTRLSSGAFTFHIWASSFHAPSFSPPSPTLFFCLWYSPTPIWLVLFFSCFLHHSTSMQCVICQHVTKPFSLFRYFQFSSILFV